MKIYVSLVILLLLTNCKPEKKVEKETIENKNDFAFYVGTYTEKDSKGIYKYVLEENGSLKKIGLAVTSNNPSFLALSDDKNYLLAVNEVNRDSVGFIESYKIDKDSLQLISRSPSGGAHPCFVGVNKEGFVVAANYTGGNVGLLKLDSSGKLSDVLDVQQHQGKGTTDRQEGPHAHSVWFEKDNQNNIIAVDLGTNELWFSKIDTTSNKLIALNKLAMAEGAGPRHVAFNPNKNIVYVLDELDNTITFISKSETGTYEIMNTISTLPEGFSEYSKAADIHISSDGKFVYASNRGHDSIAIFSVQEDGSLTLLNLESTRGNNPRNFSLSPDDSYLIVANQDTDNLVSFKRNSETGLLTFISEIEAPTPVCILFN